MPKKSKVEEPVMWKIVIGEQTCSHVTRERTPGERWDADDLEYNTTYSGFHVVDTGFYDLAVPFEPQMDKTYYLVYGIYSTGDSFHHETGRTEIVSFHEDVTEAEIVAAHLVQQYEKQKNASNTQWSIDIVANGQLFSFHAPWLGYFESLEEIVVHPIQMEPSRFRPRR